MSIMARRSAPVARGSGHHCARPQDQLQTCAMCRATSSRCLVRYVHGHPERSLDPCLCPSRRGARRTEQQPLASPFSLIFLLGGLRKASVQERKETERATKNMAKRPIQLLPCHPTDR